jgi:carboxyl-terminal processing protease
MPKLCDNSFSMDRSDRKLIYGLIGLPAVILAFFIGIYVGEKRAPLSPVSAGEGGAESTITEADMAPFWKAWRILDEKFVESASTTEQDKIYGAISGLTDSYKDPYTVFFPPVESKMFQEDISGNFEGVGMEIGIKDKQLVVVSPIKNSPAERAGVKAGDRILSIDGKPSIDMAVDAAVKLIRGKKGTAVKISFLPKDSTIPQEKTLIRDIINIPTLDSKTENGITTIRLYGFTAQSPGLFQNALRNFYGSDSRKLILDLRGNPGGYLDAAWDMASYFLPAGKAVVIEDFGDDEAQKIYRSKGYDVFRGENLQMVILVDAGSASASEILAGALQEHGVAKLVGVKTFGKGSIQELVPITSDTSLKVTIARWLTPNGHNLSAGGLEPDFVVEKTDKDTAAGKDPQMEKAVDILNKGL